MANRLEEPDCIRVGEGAGGNDLFAYVGELLFHPLRKGDARNGDPFSDALGLSGGVRTAPSW